MNQAELRELHLETWGKCPVCNYDPRQPFKDLCESCEVNRAIKFHGRPQTVRTDRRCLDEGATNG